MRCHYFLLSTANKSLHFLPIIFGKLVFCLFLDFCFFICSVLIWYHLRIYNICIIFFYFKGTRWFVIPFSLYKICFWKHKNRVVKDILPEKFFYQSFISRSLKIHRNLGEGRGSSLFLCNTSTHWWAIIYYLQLCIWNDYHVFLMASHVITRMRLDEIYHLWEVVFDWLLIVCCFNWRSNARTYCSINFADKWRINSFWLSR